MHVRVPLLPALAVLAASLILAAPPVAAQPRTIVSPVQATNTGGLGANTFPWCTSTSRRYLQIHSDLGLGPRNITRLSFRANEGTGTGTGTATVDLELFMGPGVPWNQMHYSFDRNYTAQKTTVIARKSITMGPQGAAGAPSPFSMDLLLDAPFPDLGIQSLVWEAHLHSNSIAPTLLNMDADVTSLTSANSAQTGGGCTRGGGTIAMTHAFYAVDVGGTLALGTAVLNGPPSMFALLALGGSNPNLPVQGLCSNLHTDLLLVLPIGQLDANGFLGANNVAGSWLPTGGTTFTLPNTIAGATLYSQIHALDPLSSFPIGLANSDGRQVVVPSSNTSRVVQVSRLFNNFGGTTATGGIFFPTTSMGYGLVTQFTY